MFGLKLRRASSWIKVQSTSQSQVLRIVYGERTSEGGSDTASKAARMMARCSAVSGVTGSGRYGVRLVKLVPRVIVVPVGLVTVSEYPDLCHGTQRVVPTCAGHHHPHWARHRL